MQDSDLPLQKNLSKDRDIVYKQEWHGTDWQYADNQQGVITCQYAYLMQYIGHLKKHTICYDPTTILYYITT